MTMFFAGAYLVLGSGNMLKIKEDVACIKSTVFVSVPRLYNKITEQLQGTVNAMIKGEEAKRVPVENAVFAKFR